MRCTWLDSVSFSTQVTVWRKLNASVTWELQSYLKETLMHVSIMPGIQELEREGKLAICDSSNKYTSVLSMSVNSIYFNWSIWTSSWGAPYVVLITLIMELIHELDNKSLMLAIKRWPSRAKSIYLQCKWNGSTTETLPTARCQWGYMRLSAQTRTASEETAERCLK